MESDDRFRWEGTDSVFEGTPQAWFTKRNGKSMVVLEDDRGLLHVYPVSDRLIDVQTGRSALSASEHTQDGG